MTPLIEQLGRYEVLGLIGTGGMAEVLLARLIGAAGFARPVVIKRILPHLAREERFRSMFLEEARIVAQLNHRNIVQVFELAEWDEELFLVLEYLEGESLDGLLRRLVARQERLDFECAVHIIAEACAGLAAAHERPVIHRDISPANLFVTYDGNVKIIDFGIALDADRRALTEPGHVRGKCAYMSPEQAMGSALDARSDLFSLGIVLYELTTRRRLFRRKTESQTLFALLQDPIVPPTKLVRGYPEVLERVCLRSLARRPEDRFETAVEMQSALLECSRMISHRDPSRVLKEVMQALFADRIHEKRVLLQRLSDGAAVDPVGMTEPEVDDLPTVEETLALPEQALPAHLPRTLSFVEAIDEAAPTPGPKPRVRLPLLVLAVLLTAAAAVVLGLRPDDEGDETPAVAANALELAPVPLPVTSSVVADRKVAASAPEREVNPPKKIRHRRRANKLEPYRALDDWSPLPSD